jgi:hypothetical protein
MWMLSEQLGGEILPSGVLALDQPDFLCSAPTLELLLAVDGFEHFVERFAEHKAMATVFLAEAVRQIIPVFVNPPLQVVRHSDVDHARFAGDYIDAIAVGFHFTLHQQVPPLRNAVGFANRNAPVGMTDFGDLTV